jgi:hypothetical protein
MCVGPESAFWIVMSRLRSRRPSFGAGYRFQGPDRIGAQRKYRKGGIALSRIFEIAAVVLLLSTASVIAQVAMPAEPRTVSQVMDFWVTNTEQLLVPAADVMPEAKYSFAQSNGEFSGVRTPRGAA